MFTSPGRLTRQRVARTHISKVCETLRPRPALVILSQPQKLKALGPVTETPRTSASARWESKDILCQQDDVTVRAWMLCNNPVSSPPTHHPQNPYRTEAKSTGPANRTREGSGLLAPSRITTSDAPRPATAESARRPIAQLPRTSLTNSTKAPGQLHLILRACIRGAISRYR